MSIFRNLNEDGDWGFGAGVESYGRDLKALMLDLKTRIQSWVGDAFFDLGAGIDWKNLLGFNTQTQLKNAIKLQALQTAGVLRVNNLELTLDSARVAVISLSVDTIFGTNVQSLINVSI
jgi:hypothetical protein